MNSSPDIDSCLTEAFEDDDVHPQTVELAIGLANRLRDLGIHDKEHIMACGLLATCLDSEYQGEYAFHYLPFKTKDVSWEDYAIVREESFKAAFASCFDVMMGLNGDLSLSGSSSKLVQLEINADSLERIASGTYGTVSRYDRDIAVKSCSYDGFGIEFYCLVKELSVLARLSKYVPKLRGLGFHGMDFYVGMEYIQNTLTDLIGTLSPDRKTSIKDQLRSAIEYVHSEGIIHCDIKLANIMVNDDHVYLIDFGNCRRFSDQPRCNHIGSDPYRAYELLKDQSNNKYESVYGPEVDIWSLGIVFYFIDHEKAPFDFGLGSYAAVIESSCVKYGRMLELDPSNRRL